MSSFLDNFESSARRQKEESILADGFLQRFREGVHALYRQFSGYFQDTSLFTVSYGEAVVTIRTVIEVRVELKIWTMHVVHGAIKLDIVPVIYDRPYQSNEIEAWLVFNPGPEYTWAWILRYEDGSPWYHYVKLPDVFGEQKTPLGQGDVDKFLYRHFIKLKEST